MARLATETFTTFRDLLLDCFPGNDLIELTRVALDETLGNIVGLERQTGRDIASDLIKWVEARGLTRKLIVAVQAERPLRADVQACCSRALMELEAAPPTSPAANEVRVRVIEFRTAFAQRREWFDRLNAYKRLHEVLHKLLEMQDGIEDAVKRFHDEPPRSLRLEQIANALEDDLLDEAKKANKDTEFPKEAERWIGSFQKAVDDLRASLVRVDLTALDRSVAALRALPHQQQTGLDRELIRCADRLKAEALAAMLDVILAGEATLTAAGDLRAGLSRFRNFCGPLGGLTTDHNLCQEVETALAAVPAEDATKERVFQWPDVLAALLRIVGGRPDDRTAERMVGYARAFDAATDAATASAQFSLLRDQFGRLFSKTDKDLLAVTDGLVREAALLNAQLWSLP